MKNYQIGNVVEFRRNNGEIGLGYIHAITGTVDIEHDTHQIDSYVVKHIEIRTDMPNVYEVDPANILSELKNVMVDIESLEKQYDKLLESQHDKAKEAVSNAKCSCCNCKSFGKVVPSITVKDRFYATCGTCGNVVYLVRDKLRHDNWIVQETPRRQDEYTQQMMIDALNSYEEAGMPIAVYGTTKEELEAKKAELFKDEEQEIKEEAELEAIILNHSTGEFYVVPNNKEAINKIIKDHVVGTDDIEVRVLGSKFDVEKKIEITVK